MKVGQCCGCSREAYSESVIVHVAGAVHMVGGVAGLAGAWVAGPRLGRFNSQGKPQPIHGHNAVYYTIGAYPSPWLPYSQ